MLNQTGTRTFGVFLLLANLVILSSISDLGIGNGSINQLVENNGNNNQGSLISNVTLSTLITSSAIGLLAIIIVIIFPMKNLFNIPSSIEAEFTIALYVAILSYAFMPLSALPNKIYLAKFENKKSALYSLSTALISNILLIIFAILRFPMWTYVLAQTFLPVLIGLCTIKFAILKDSDSNILKRKFEYNSITNNLKNGRTFLVLQLCAVVSYQIDSLIVSHYLGPEQVTTLVTTWKICSLPVIVISYGFLPIWQNSRESDLSGNRNLVFKQLSNSIKKLSFPLGIFIFIFFLGGAEFISFWSSDLVKVEKSMIFFSCVWLFLYSISQPIAYTLNGLKENNFNLATAISLTISNVTLSIYFTNRLQSPVGPLIGSSLSQFVFFLLPFYLFRKNIKNKSNKNAEILRRDDSS